MQICITMTTMDNLKLICIHKTHQERKLTHVLHIKLIHIE